MINAQNYLSHFEDEFPLSAKYDPAWVIDNMMGPNALWLTESLSQVMDLKPGMRVLDLGCGKALSSIFLAKEFDLDVWACDLWISASDNMSRIAEAGIDDRVFPIHAEAHTLPFADGFFDAIVSLDAYHYFGTDDLYLGWHLAKLAKPGAQIGVVVPGLVNELGGNIPDHLKPYWEPDFSTFHSAAWWRDHWEKSRSVSVEVADMIENGWKHWAAFQDVCGAKSQPDSAGAQEAEMLRTDAGRNLGFVRLLGNRSA